MNVEVALEAQAGFAEAPTWDSASSTLLWVDMSQCQVHRYNPATGGDLSIGFPQPVAAAKPRALHGLVLSLRDGVALTDADGSFRWILDWSTQGVRGNDAGIDSEGRLWIGTIAGDSTPGWLGTVSAQGTLSVTATDIAISNGIAWSPDLTRMYYVDSPTRRIDVFDYDAATGHAANRRMFTSVTDTTGVPDGLCTDTAGGVWAALFRGGAVRRYAPDGRLDREISLPSTLTTACTFGGPNLTDLYVTSARRDLGDTQPMAGSLFVIPDIAQGNPGFPFQG